MTEKQARTLTSLWASSTTALGNCTPMGAGAPWTSRKAYDAFRPPPSWATATPTQSRPIQKELVRQVGEEIATSEDLRLPQQDHAHVRRTVSSAPRCPRRFSLSPSLSGPPCPPAFFPILFSCPPQYPRRFPRQPSFSEIPLHINSILTHVAPERGPAQKALSRSSQGCHPTLPSQPKYGLRVATSRCSASN